MPLTPQQQAFVASYSGDTARAAHAAKVSEAVAQRWLEEPEVRDALRTRDTEEQRFAAKKASKAERLAFWSDVMRDPGRADEIRIKASDLLGKAEGDFVTRQEVSGPNGGPIASVNLQIDAGELEDRMKVLVAKKVTPVIEAKEDWLG